MGRGITFDDKYHTYKDWGLKLLSFYMPLPRIKENYIDIPGMNGSLDLTEVFGQPLYSDREGIEIVFDLLDGSYSKWFATCEKISAVLHGRKVKMILDDELGRFYNVRLSVNHVKSNAIMSQVTLSGRAEPYKYDTQDRGDPWLWDSFNFETGKIYEPQYRNVVVNGGYELDIEHNGMPVTPTFVCSAEMTVEFDNIVYTLSPGQNKVFDIIIDKDATLIFKGTGTLTVNYRGGAIV